MSEKPKESGFSLDDVLICKQCKEPFSLRSAYGLLHGLKFPNRNTSVIEAKCPICRSERHYTSNDLWQNKEGEQDSPLIKQLRSELAQATTEKDVIKKLYEDLLLQVKDIIKSSQTSNSKDPKMEAIK